MKVSVDGQRCQGHTLCSMIAPESFELNDVDGHASPVSDVVPADQITEGLEERYREGMTLREALITAVELLGRDPVTGDQRSLTTSPLGSTG